MELQTAMLISYSSSFKISRRLWLRQPFFNITCYCSYTGDFIQAYRILHWFASYILIIILHYARDLSIHLWLFRFLFADALMKPYKLYILASIVYQTRSRYMISQQRYAISDIGSLSQQIHIPQHGTVGTTWSRVEEEWEIICAQMTNEIGGVKLGFSHTESRFSLRFSVAAHIV